MMTRSHPYYHLEKKKIKVGEEQVQRACGSEELDPFEELAGKAHRLQLEGHEVEDIGCGLILWGLQGHERSLGLILV